MRSTLLIFSLLLASAPVHADKVYKWVDAQGNVTYSDQPHPGAQEIKIDKSPSSATRSLAALDQADSFRYSSIQLDAPTNEATIRDNDGNVKVAVSVVPPLRVERGDRIKLYLDGSLVADLSAPETVLSGLDQGSHTLQAVVTERDGRVLAGSDPIEFYLKHWSILAPRGPNIYPPVYPSQLVKH